MSKVMVRFIGMFAEGQFNDAFWQLLLLIKVNTRETGKFRKCDFANI
jgi:hypothetical protein